MNQQQSENGRGGPQPHIGVDASNLFFTVRGASATGFEYLYRLTLETIPGSDSTFDQNYIEFRKNGWVGQIGNNVGPADTMIFDAGKIIGGTGGFDGAYNNVYNMSAGVMRGNDNVGDTGNATKIVVYTPEAMGFRVGLSYTPNTKHRGDEGLDTRSNRGGYNRIPGNRGLYPNNGVQPFDLRNIELGITYKKEMGKWSMTLSAAGITAKSYFFDSNGPIGAAQGRRPVQNTKAYQLGGILGYGDWRFGAGYLDNGKSHLPRTPNFMVVNNNVSLDSMYNGNAGKAWNVGAGYTMGAYQFAASYQGTTRDTGNIMKAKSDFYSATVDVTPLQGLKVYTEIDYIQSRTNTAAVARESSVIAAAGSKPFNRAIGNNSALLGIVGTKISF
jgi:hypothetical protein